MATTPTPQVQATIAPPPAEREIRIYSHSVLFYWWPVWAFGFLMAILTAVDNHVMAIVPPGTVAERDRNVEGHGTRDVLVLPQGAHLLPKPSKSGEAPAEPAKAHIKIAANGKLGVLWAVVLLVTIVISNAPMRGLWSVIIILFFVLLILILVLTGWYEWLRENIALLDIRINEGGYWFISIVLFVIWAVTVFIFDHRTYVIITPGQVRLCLAVGAGETVYDTTGMTFQKQQNDLFRHWIVGLGSGDLILHRTNTNQEIDLPNVLFIGAKIREIERLLKEREVV